jgi:hypothetical protein
VASSCRLCAPHPALTAASMSSGYNPRRPASGVPQLARGGGLGGSRGRSATPMAAESTSSACRTARGGRRRPPRWRPAARRYGLQQVGDAAGLGRRAAVRPTRVPVFLRRPPSWGSRSRRRRKGGSLGFLRGGGVGAREGCVGRGNQENRRAGASPVSGGGMGEVRELGGRRRVQCGESNLREGNVTRPVSVGFHHHAFCAFFREVRYASDED